MNIFVLTFLSFSLVIQNPFQSNQSASGHNGSSIPPVNDADDAESLHYIKNITAPSYLSIPKKETRSSSQNKITV